MRFSWFGIDFGTTNSAAFSYTGIDENTIKPIHYGDDEGRPFPSVVAINKETGEIVVGRDAKDRRNSLQETHFFFSSIKTLLDSKETWSIANRVWTAEDIASEILKALKARVERDNDNDLDEVVMAVPVGYSAGKKEHLRNAAKKAGINIRMFVSEPTAAFCSNYSQLMGCKNVAVFDWGGGTLDVVILRIDDGAVYELASDGMQFAGNNIDKKLAEKLHARFMRNKAGAIEFEDLDPVTKDQLLVKCEKAKCDFEDEDVVVVSLNKYGSFGTFRENMEYDYFSLLIEPDVNNAIKCLNNAIEKSGLNVENIDRILCVGGSCRLRPLQEKLTGLFSEEMLLYPDRVMWDIAKGAALIATKTSGYRLSKSIGLKLSDGSYFPLLNRGQQLPCKELNLTFSVTDQDADGPKEARIVIMDSDSDTDRALNEQFVFPLRGFADEKLKISCYVDQNNIFKMRIGSSRIDESKDKVWCYDKLKISFHLEDK